MYAQFAQQTLVSIRARPEQTLRSEGVEGVDFPQTKGHPHIS